ncbi:MAG: DUF1800 domain-containing protein [Candidatus Hydrogenedentes bacterium]|nr:DUF1800 domain-containing protein [Candidatus Hydrogenedentota bacterium]
MRSDLLRPMRASAWDTAKARHLLNRAGFGIPSERYRELARKTPAQAVDALIDYEALPAAPNRPEFLLPSEELEVERRAARDLPEPERTKAFMEMRRRERARIKRLKAWWLERMATTARPLEEKMTLFWHGHFATSAQKVQSSWWNHHLNDVFRSNATGNFKVLTTEVGTSPAMLHYLDNRQNRRGKPNENWARELMELFTMGVGNYTEDDIKESARAFTGWMFDDYAFVFNPRAHDNGTKTFLGERGNFDGWDIIDILFKQPVTAKFIAEKLWAFFAYENPEPEGIAVLAQIFREHNYELKPVLRQLFLSEAFYSERAMGSQIKSPVQFMLQLVHNLELESPPYGPMTQGTAALGQNLFYPPNVKGWDGGRAWINANTLLFRYNIPKMLIVAAAQQRRIDDDPSMGGENAMDRGMGMKPHEQFRRYMQGLPQEERKRIRRQLGRASTDMDRRRMVMEIVKTQPLEGLWDARPLFSGVSRGTRSDFVRHLAGRFLSVPITQAQTRILAEALHPNATDDTLLYPRDLEEKNMFATVHLLVGLAEYQLC